MDRYPRANRGTTFFKEAGFMWRNWIICFIFFVKIKKHNIIRVLEAASGFRMRSKDSFFHNDQKTTRRSKCTAVTEKLTTSEVKFK